MSAVGTTDAPWARTVRTFAGVPIAVPAMIAAAWVLAVVAEGNGAGFVRNSVRSAGEGTSHAGQSPITLFCPLHLGAAGGSGVLVGPGHTHAGSFWLAFALFLVAWQAMIVAMMLPSSLPLVRLFSVASARAPGRGRALLAFLSGYALVWTAFGAVAFAGDALVHRLIADNAGLRAHQSMIVAGVLALAGAAQFTPLKDRCLTECRHPGAFLMRHCRRGTRGSFMLGRRHGLFCLGGCWALTLVMFVAGVADLIFMGALTVLMVYEKTATRGAEGVPTAGSRCSHGRPSCSCTHTGFRRHSAGAADHHDRAAIATNTPILGEARPPARTTHRPSPLRFATSFGTSREFLAHSRSGQGRDWCGGSSQLAGASQNGETRTQIGDTTIFRERREKALPAESLQLSTSNVAPSGRVAHGLGRLPARVRLRGGFEVPNDVVRMSDFHRTPLPPVGLRSR